MVREPARIRISALEWDEVNEGHFQLHDVTPENVEAVLDNNPLFFENLLGRAGSHVMIGADDRGRVLYVSLQITVNDEVWRPITGWESRFARKLWTRD